MKKPNFSFRTLACAILITGFFFSACPMDDTASRDPVPKSDDPDLSGLEIAGFRVEDLGKGAEPGEESFIVPGKVEIPPGVKNAVTVTPSSKNASYRYYRSTDGNPPANEDGWLNAVPTAFDNGDFLFIRVTSESGNYHKIYKIEIVILKTATLNGIFIGGKWVTSLGTPNADAASAEAGAFSVESSDLSQMGENVQISVMAADSSADIQYAVTTDANPPASFATTSSFPLSFGNFIWIRVISEDEEGSTTNYYKIAVSEVTGSTPGDWAYTPEWAAAFKAALPAPSVYNAQGENWEWPDLFTFWDGTPVLTRADWKKRYQEIKIIIQHYLYGYLPPAPSYSSITYNAGARTITINMTYEGNSASVTTGAITWPSNTSLYPAETGMPLSFGGTATHDGAKGYALMGVPGGAAWNTAISSLYSNKMAADDYPGDLMRTAWGLERVIDAIEYLNGQVNLGGMQYRIDPAKTTITGHSRGGKDAIVGAAFSRVSVAAPSSSGAYGVAPERFIRTIVLPTNQAKLEHRYNGKGFYYLSVARGSGSNANAVPRKNWILPVLQTGTTPPDFEVAYGPIQSIQNYDHGRWDSTAGGNMATNTMSTWPGARMRQFTSNNLDQFYTAENGFQDKGSMAQIPFDAHYVTALMAGPDPENPRGLIITVGGDGDSWVNPEGSYFVFLVTRQLFQWLGKENNVAYFMDPPNGHTHTNFRRARQADLCEYMWKGTSLPQNVIADNTGFLMKDAAGPMEGLLGRGSPYPLDIRNYDDYMLIKTAPPGQQSVAEIAEAYFRTNPTY
jgi:hypothetical protein